MMRGSSPINKTNKALRDAILVTFGEKGLTDIELKLIALSVHKANEVVRSSFTATRQKDKRRALLRQPGVFASAQESVDFIIA